MGHVDRFTASLLLLGHLSFAEFSVSLPAVVFGDVTDTVIVDVSVFGVEFVVAEHVISIVGIKIVVIGVVVVVVVVVTDVVVVIDDDDAVDDAEVVTFFSNIGRLF